MIAVFAGLLSFLSPCYSLVPAYVGYLSGRAVRNEVNYPPQIV